MRLSPAIVLVTLWIGCGSPSHGGHDGGGDSPAADACEGLRCKVTDCERMRRPPTTISGTVFAPNGTLPLWGVSVYVPNVEPGPFADGAQCWRCDEPLPGDPIASTLSNELGHFELRNVPSGEDIPLIITVGKWRRRITVPVVTECTDNPLPLAQTSLPKHKLEGDLPKIAISTGSGDALECFARKLGIADAEFTDDTSDGRVHLFASNGANKTASGLSFAPASTLWGSVDKLKQYDLAMFSCEGSQLASEKPQAAMDAVKAYADLGGRVFLSHFQNVWISGDNGDPTHAPAGWPAIASCRLDATATGPGIIEPVLTYGLSFALWMEQVGASTTRGQFPITDAFQTCTSLDRTKAERWAYLQSGASQLLQGFQFTTPNEVASYDRCGKVVFSDMHVASGSSSSPAVAFPDGCSTAPMTPQEKASAFLFFQMDRCDLL